MQTVRIQVKLRQEKLLSENAAGEESMLGANPGNVEEPNQSRKRVETNKLATQTPGNRV